MTTGRPIQYVLLGFYVACSAVLLAYSVYRPYYNWDMIPYAACAKSFEVRDRVALHRWIYAELERSVPPDTYRYLTAGPYRRTVSEDAEAFAQQLPFYQIRVLYNALVFLFAKMGIHVLLATHLVSALSAIAGLWIVLLAFRPFVGTALLFLLPPFAVVFGVLDVAKYATPDGLAFLMVCSMAYLLVRRHRGLLVLLPLCVLVRTDLILFVFLIGIYSFVFGSRTLRVATVASLAIAAGCYVVVNVAYGYYGLSVTYYMTFLEAVPYPADAGIEFGFRDYLRLWPTHAQEILTNAAFLVFVAVGALTTGTIVWRAPDMRDSSARGLLFVSLSSFAYVIAHLVVFPEIEERFFAGQYLLSLAVLLSLIHRNGVARR